MLLPLRYPRVWLVVGWSLIAAAILASLLPVHDLPEVGTNDKVGHMAAYALLSLWFSGLYPRSRYPLIATGLFALGLVIEGAQGAMQLGRQPEMYDMVANALGIVVGLTVALLGLGGWALRVEQLIRRK